MNARRTLALAGLLCLVGSALPAAAQVIRYVDDDASTNGDGLTWDTAYRYLQDALFEASGDPTITEIRVAGGVYKPDQDEGGIVTPGDRLATFQMLNGLALMGGYRGCPLGDCSGDPDERDFALYVSTLSGDLLGNDGPEFADNDENSYHVVTGSGTDLSAVLDGFTLTAGNADAPGDPHRDGGGMYIEAGAPHVRNCLIGGNWANSWGGGVGNREAGTFLDSCTFLGNHAYSGGGTADWFGSMTLESCTFRGNDADFGGGMLTHGEDLTVVDCTFDANLAVMGGGVYHDGAGIPGSRSLTGCTFTNNWAEVAGGGVYNYREGVFEVVDCRFIGNSADISGGGIDSNVYGIPTITNCEFIGNSAIAGGAIKDSYGSPVIANCTFGGNTAEMAGAGIYCADASYTTLANCAFSGNSAPDGTALACYSADSATPSTVWIANSILWDGGSEISNADGSTITVSFSDVFGGWTGEGNIDADPLFVDADGPDDVPGTLDDNLRLSAGSPCIDAGSNLAVPPDWPDLDGDGDTAERTPLDLWGLPRFWNDPDTDDTGVADPPDYPDVVDMGAYEYHLPGDLDFDGDIDGDDYWLFAAALPSCAGDPQYDPAADLDFDGCVTLTDYSIWLELYRAANPPLPAPVPGPKPGGPGDMDGSQTERDREGGLIR